MTDDQKTKKRAREIGSFSTLGGGKRSERQIPRNEDIAQSPASNNQISGNLDKESVQYPEEQKSDISDSKQTGKRDIQVVTYTREKKPERKAQIAYLPPALIKRLKLYALQHDLEISEVVTEALERFLPAQEG
jgi:hypothetical protein